MARRGRGDGGITQRHDHKTCPKPVDGVRPAHRCRGRWQGTYTVTVDGESVKKYVYGKSRQECAQNLSDVILKRNTGTLVLAPVHVLTMGEWFDHFLNSILAEQVATGERNVNTEVAYRNAVLHLPEGWRRIKLTDVQPDTIRRWRAHLRTVTSRRGTPLADSTIRHTDAVLKRCLKLAAREDKIPFSPYDKMDPLGSAPGNAVEVLREGYEPHVTRMILASVGTDVRWYLALFYGMRQGECLGLRWADVDLDEGTVVVRGQLKVHPTTRELYYQPFTKGKRPRFVPLMPKHLALFKLAYENANRPGPEAYVFTREDGTPWTATADYERWLRVCKRAGAPRKTLHEARNSAAALMESEGIPDRIVAQILGHSQVQTSHHYQRQQLGVLRQMLAQVSDEPLAIEAG